MVSPSALEPYLPPVDPIKKAIFAMVENNVLETWKLKMWVLC